MSKQFSNLKSDFQEFLIKDEFDFKNLQKLYEKFMIDYPE